MDLEDIKQKLISDFGEKPDEAWQLIFDGLSGDEILFTPRIIRCIIYLAKGNLSGLKKAIQQAQGDPRDVMYWAEYINQGKLGEAIRVRDFNRVFGEEEISSHPNPKGNPPRC